MNAAGRRVTGSQYELGESAVGVHHWERKTVYSGDISNLLQNEQAGEAAGGQTPRITEIAAALEQLVSRQAAAYPSGRRPAGSRMSLYRTTASATLYTV